MSQSAQLTVQEAARLLDRSTEQVRRYLREGKLAGTRIGGQWFIDRAGLDEFQRDLHATPTFLRAIPPAADADPLGAVIGLGSGGRSNIALGKSAYREHFRWRQRR